jgi:hypothetical protein
MTGLAGIKDGSDSRANKIIVECTRNKSDEVLDKCKQVALDMLRLDNT